VVRPLIVSGVVVMHALFTARVDGLVAQPLTRLNLVERPDLFNLLAGNRFVSSERA
jgi:hypothetical protein